MGRQKEHKKAGYSGQLMADWWAATTVLPLVAE
jgi:hypothetical protein